ncbi:interleukin-7 receptor subunit alpha [Hyperolius riggenbachi]|uniref:interleukin-7 receptor subunit alpha n=1 Tax=Hyperolius riggenbachi TaxID=752182 RepID=UPI0035A374B5
MHITAVAVLLLLVCSSLEQTVEQTMEQSGDDADLKDDEQEVSMGFDCYSNLSTAQKTLICCITPEPPERTGNVEFTACTTKDRDCARGGEHQPLIVQTSEEEHNVCMIWNEQKVCKSLDIRKIERKQPKQEVRMNFECFSKIRLYKYEMICYVTQRPSESTADVSFLEGKVGTENWTPIKEREPWTNRPLFSNHNVCMVWNEHKFCKTYVIERIAMPDRPTNLTITYNNESESYVVNIRIPYEGNEYLRTALIHQVVLRKNGKEWPVCGQETINSGKHKSCFEGNDIDIPKKNLDNSAQYEARVRSKPNGIYYDGPWSEWSDTVPFVTVKDTVDKGEDILLPVVCLTVVLAVLLVIIVLIKCFWKNRIKPVIWPEIPDHKNALEKLCHKPKHIHISFNPDYFDNYLINKVDYMKAQVRTEDNFQNFSTTTQREAQLGINTCNGTTSPEVGSKDPFTNFSHIGPCSEPSGHMTASETQGNSSQGNSGNFEKAILSSSDWISKCNASGSPVTSVASSNVVKQPNNGLRGFCWDDFYIAMSTSMSAFKTPNNTVKQSVNI